MQVLGDLIRLPIIDQKGLPLPWWHRAPLGLSHRTSVFVALTKTSTGRPAADLIVTVLNPSYWTRMFRLDCYKKDAPGVVAEVFKRAPPLNIALAEAVKLEKDNMHHVSLICEPAYYRQDTAMETARMTEELRQEGFEVDISPLPPLPELVWNRTGDVEHGWVTGVKWREEIARTSSEKVGRADLMRVVVSADTESRVLRFVFPRFGAMTLSIRHADEPGALAGITSALRACDLNILSAFLRRGGAGAKNAELVAVCEPIDDIGANGIGPLKERIGDQIRTLPHNFRAQHSINEGKYAEDTIYSRDPGEIVARVPTNLAAEVTKQRNKLKSEALRLRVDTAGENVIPIFLSRRFSKSTQNRIVEDARAALRANACLPVEGATGIARDPFTIYSDVSSKMWATKAGIVLVIKDTGSEHVSINVALELGFLLGQGKMVLLLVEDEPECIEAMRSFANIAGVQFVRFEPKVASDKQESLHFIVKEWVKTLRQDLARE